MTKPIKHTYRIQYVDNTYQMVEWTKKEFMQVGNDMGEGKFVTVLDEGMFRVSDIRAVVFIPPVPEPTEAERKAEAEQQLSEWGFVDQETAEWLRINGIDLSKGVN